MDTWTRASLQFTNLGRAEASATATGLTTVTTSSSTSSHLSTITRNPLGRLRTLGLVEYPVNKALDGIKRYAELLFD